MSHLPQKIIMILSLFAPLFSRRVWPQARTLLVPGKRTVSVVLAVLVPQRIMYWPAQAAIY